MLQFAYSCFAVPSPPTCLPCSLPSRPFAMKSVSPSSSSNLQVPRLPTPRTSSRLSSSMHMCLNPRTSRPSGLRQVLLQVCVQHTPQPAAPNSRTTSRHREACILEPKDSDQTSMKEDYWLTEFEHFPELQTFGVCQLDSFSVFLVLQPYVMCPHC